MSQLLFNTLHSFTQHYLLLIFMLMLMTLLSNQVNCGPTFFPHKYEGEESVGKSIQETHSRMKRSGISDQRLAELETLLALKRMRDEHLKNRMVAFGLFDPEQIGRRRRRSSNLDQRGSLFDQIWKPESPNQLPKE